MDAKVIAILVICIAAVLAAGCTGGSAPPAGTATPAPPAPAPGVTTVPADAQSCTTGADCVPAQCCHPTSCTGKAAAPSCNNAICTMSCEGPIDCGAGSCGCVNGKCSVVPASPGKTPAAPETSVRLGASPQRYSPIMSSTPGIRLTVNATGFTPSDAQFRWSAGYGHFLAWNAPDFRVTGLGNPYMNNGETIYWAFVEKPASTKDPVTVTVEAKDSRSGMVLGTSTVILNWDGDYAVYVGEIR